MINFIEWILLEDEPDLEIKAIHCIHFHKLTLQTKKSFIDICFVIFFKFMFICLQY